LRSVGSLAIDAAARSSLAPFLQPLQRHRDASRSRNASNAAGLLLPQSEPTEDGENDYD
jgi:hypothetical protein